MCLITLFGCSLLQTTTASFMNIIKRPSCRRNLVKGGNITEHVEFYELLLYCFGVSIYDLSEFTEEKTRQREEMRYNQINWFIIELRPWLMDEMHFHDERFFFLKIADSSRHSRHRKTKIKKFIEVKMFSLFKCRRRANDIIKSKFLWWFFSYDAQKRIEEILSHEEMKILNHINYF